jgi:DNA (cytosine-5)-methyltransferase 1
MPLRVGSLCSGFGGLEMGLREVFGDIELAFVADNDPDACKVLECRFPGVPNLGDLREICYDEVEPVDILAAGFPCTDVSGAGKREGLIRGNRTGLWYEIARAIAGLRPPVVFAENVLGLLSYPADSHVEYCPGCMADQSGKLVLRAFGRVLGDLSAMGYDTRWGCLRAADAGAPHGRMRVFILGWLAADPDGDPERAGALEGRG